jgi:hypothetical protein
MIEPCRRVGRWPTAATGGRRAEVAVALGESVLQRIQIDASELWLG